jgi:hypothetical protein
MSFIGFTFVQDGIVYCEAYPVFTPGSGQAALASLRASGVVADIIEAPSLNQARKYVYKLVVDPSGAGFNKYPSMREDAKKAMSAFKATI